MCGGAKGFKSTVSDDGLLRFWNNYLLHFCELPAGVLVVAQVLFVPHQDDGNVGTEMFDLGSPLLGDVL